MADRLRVREAPSALTLGGLVRCSYPRVRAPIPPQTSGGPRPPSGLLDRTPVGAGPPRTLVVPRSQRSRFRALRSTSPRHASIRFNLPHPRPYQLPDYPSTHTYSHRARTLRYRPPLFCRLRLVAQEALRTWHPAWRRECFSRLRSTLANEHPSRRVPPGVHEGSCIRYVRSHPMIQ